MTGRQDIFQQAMNQGHSAAWDQNWDKAAEYYQHALEEFPEHTQALTNMGLALFELQEFNEALRYYEQAARVSPEDPVPMEKIAQLSERLGKLQQATQTSLRSAELYLKNRDVDKALENWTRVTRLDPDNLQAHSRLAVIYDRVGEKQKAVTAYVSVARIMQERDEREKAVQAANQALKVMPNSEEAIQAMTLLRDFKPLPKPERPKGATAPIRMSQVKQLEAPVEQADRGINPVAEARQKALTVLADMLFQTASEEDRSKPTGRPGLQEIVAGTGGSGSLQNSGDQTRVALHLGQVVDYQTKDEYVKAADELVRAMEAGFEHAAADFDLGYLYAENGRLESAVRHLQYAVKHEDFALGARLLLGDLLRQKKELREAAINYMEALKLADAQIVPAPRAPDLRQLYEPLIEAQRQETNPELQERLCDNIKEMLMRSDWRSHLLRAREQLPEVDATSPPIPLAEMITEARSSEVVESISKIYELTARSYLRSAMEESFYALEHAPTYLPLHSYMGELMLQQENVEGAVAKFTVVAKTYSMRGEMYQAITLYRRIIELSPMDMSVRRRLIDLLDASGQSEEAIEEYLALADVYYSMADLEMSRQMFAEAVRLAQHSNVDISWQVKALHKMADIDLQSLEWRQALRIFEQIRTLEPDNIKARVNLVGVNFRLGQEQEAVSELDKYLTYLSDRNDMDAALVFLNELLQENPERIQVRRRLADLYRHIGRKDDAIGQLDAIGEMFLEEGDHPSAIQTIEMILELDPPNRISYQQLIDQLRTA